MFSGLKALDGLLRGQSTTAESLRTSAAPLRLRVFVPWSLGLGACYGFFMGWYAICSGQSSAVWQAAASTIKLPMLFLATLIVTFPSLYVFNALIGCRLTFVATLRLLVAAIVINLCVGASLGPILGFFTLSTSSYAFIVLLNVALLGIAGCIGLGFLLKTLRAVAQAAATESYFHSAAEAQRLQEDAASAAEIPPPAPGTPAALAIARSAKRMQDEHARATLGAADGVFRVWVVIYALVGVQMGWLLRPFIGHPDLPFEWFRGGRSGNFFQAVFQALKVLFGLGDLP